MRCDIVAEYRQRTVLSGPQARAALIIAATRRALLTYGELGMTLDMGGVSVRNHLRHVLDNVSEDCRARDEVYSHPALVVNKGTGEPGPGWTNGTRDSPQEVRRVFQTWTPK
jgi:hypothetical protein